MIIDTSALVAVIWREPGHRDLLDAMLAHPGFVPAPVLVEFERVVAGTRADATADAVAFFGDLLTDGVRVLAFGESHALTAIAANAAYGSGNRRGGTLNLLDLMVYACAKVEGRPILCTGRDFAATDADIHPASRTAF